MKQKLDLLLTTQVIVMQPIGNHGATLIMIGELNKGYEKYRVSSMSAIVISFNAEAVTEITKPNETPIIYLK